MASQAINQRGIFISYRREETASYAGRLYDRLTDRFGEGQIFMDVDSILPGVDFTQAIAQAVGSCRVLLAVIGRSWLTAADQKGRRRIDDPQDFVRLEIEAALDRNILVIPVLVDGAMMPTSGDLPDSIYKLSRRNALRIENESFRRDFDWLFEVIQKSLSEYQSKSSDTKRLDPTAFRRLFKPSEPVVQPSPSPREEWTAKVVKRTGRLVVVEIQLTHATYQLRVEGPVFRMIPTNSSLVPPVTTTSKGVHFTLQDGTNQVRADCIQSSALGAIWDGVARRAGRGTLKLNGRLACTW
jgi:TIR domain